MAGGLTKKQLKDDPEVTVAKYNFSLIFIVKQGYLLSLWLVVISKYCQLHKTVKWAVMIVALYQHILTEDDTS